MNTNTSHELVIKVWLEFCKHENKFALTPSIIQFQVKMQITTVPSYVMYSISQEICTRFLLCCALLWLYIDWFSHIHQAYFTGTVAI